MGILKAVLLLLLGIKVKSVVKTSPNGCHHSPHVEHHRCLEGSLLPLTLDSLMILLESEYQDQQLHFNNNNNSSDSGRAKIVKALGD